MLYHDLKNKRSWDWTSPGLQLFPPTVNPGTCQSPAVCSKHLLPHFNLHCSFWFESEWEGVKHVLEALWTGWKFTDFCQNVSVWPIPQPLLKSCPDCCFARTLLSQSLNMGDKAHNFWVRFSLTCWKTDQVMLQPAKKSRSLFQINFSPLELVDALVWMWWRERNGKRGCELN